MEPWIYSGILSFLTSTIGSRSVSLFSRTSWLWYSVNGFDWKYYISNKWRKSRWSNHKQHKRDKPFAYFRCIYIYHACERRETFHCLSSTLIPRCIFEWWVIGTALRKLWNPLSTAVPSKCASIWNKGPVNIWNDLYIILLIIFDTTDTWTDENKMVEETVIATGKPLLIGTDICFNHSIIWMILEKNDTFINN